ncbi:Protein TRM32 [Linum grandiflorum]
MAKKSQKRLDRNAKPGCMWGLINMLDFRHGRTTPKLLPDRRRETKRVIGSGNKNIKLDVSLNTDQKASDGDGHLAMTSEFGKPSVKKLIEQDLLKEHKSKSEISDSEVKPNSEDDVQKRKNSKRTKRSRSKSCEIHVEDLNTVDIREAEQPYPQYLEKQSSINIDVGEMIEEFCHQLQQKSSSCIRHGESCEFHQPKQNNLDFEERWKKAIEVFVRKKVNERRKLLGDGRNVCSSKELKDALHNLLSDGGELSSKLSQGQKCIIMKQLERAWNSQVESDEDSTLAVRRNMEDQDLCKLNKSHEPSGTKHRRFFRRAKSRANNPSVEADSCKASNRIVILKPAPTVESSRKSQLTNKDKGSNERGNFHFSLAEIKRRLKNALGKETPRVSSGHTSKRYSSEVRVSGDGDKRFKENTGNCSSGKEHFFVEKIVRPSASAGKAHMNVKHKGSEQSIEVEASNRINPMVSSIYVEAKKHLSEMLITGTEDVDLPTPSGHVPKPLGRILSFPEYNFSPVSSPARELRPSFVTAQMRLPSMDSACRRSGNISHTGSDLPSFVSEESADRKAQVLSDPTSCSSSELVHDGDGEKPVGSTRDELMPGGDVEIENSAPEERILDGNLAETSSRCVIINDRNDDSSDVGDEKEKNELLKHESCLLESPSASHILEATEIVHRPSPVSVLEPLFAEEDISPAASRTQHVELVVQPLRIDFEEQDSSSSDPMLEYVKSVVVASGLNWEDFYLMSDSSEQILDPSSSDEFEFLPNQLCCDKQLLFNCIDEVLMEVYDSYFGCSPGLSVGKPVIRPIPDMKHTTDEVWRRLNWHLLPFPSPRTLDQVVRKDMMKIGVWMDIRRDTETVLVDISNVVFEELIEETVFCLSECR